MATAIERRFQLAEQQLRRQETAREQQEKEALRRRFASMGGLGSGAAIKSEMLAGEAASKRLAEGRGQLEIAKLGEMSRQEEIAAQRAFQRREREAGQTFATGERSAAQEFAGSQAEAQRLAEAQARGEEATLAKELQTMKNDIENRKVEIAQGELSMSEIVSAFNMGNTLPFKTWLNENYGGSSGLGGGITDSETSKFTPSPSENLKNFLSSPNISNLQKMPDSMFFSVKQKNEAIAKYNALIQEGLSPDMIEIRTDRTTPFPGDPKFMVEVRRREIQPGASGGTPFGGILDSSKPPPPKPAAPKGLSAIPKFTFDFKIPQPGPIRI